MNSLHISGTYTYPISIPVPADVPPTLECEYGSTTWRLRARVHRPGVFTSSLQSTREVIIVACPDDDDTENNEAIIVERQWDNQLQYLINVSGRSFYIGGVIPIHFALMPLAKAKVHRITVFLEGDPVPQIHRNTV
jgi:arrestin-related trafficking adapter 3/6